MIRQTLQRILSYTTLAERRVLVGAVIVVGLSAVGNRLVWAEPKVVYPTAPALGITHVSNTRPVTIVFSHPVNKKLLRYAIHPELKGTWKITRPIFSIQSKLIFTPTESPELDTRYTIELAGIQAIIGGQPKKYLLSFQTDTTPTLVSVSPAAAAVDVMPDAPIILTFDKPVSDAVEFLATITPDVTLEKPKANGNSLTFSHAVQFIKNTTYAIKVTRQTARVNYTTGARTVSEEPTEVIATTFTTVIAPGITTYTPTGSSVDPATPIQLEFQQAMEHASTEAAFSLSPAVAGAFTWPSDQTMIFTPTAPLAKGQLYTVTVTTAAKAANGVTPDQNFTFSFTTLGAVTASFSPAGGSTKVDPATAITVNFNQEVAHASAESKFSITPSVPGTFTWNSNSMIFHPSSALAYSTGYTATVAAGVQSVRGLDSVSAFSAKFTTRTQSVTLNVPAYAQAHVYSCMIAAARSALAFRGVNVSESAIISKVGIDPTKWSGTWGGDNGVWGDPDAAIVGPLDNSSATQPAGKKTTNVYWGYGSHWGPISRALTSFGVSNEVRTGMTVQALAQSITDGNPVIIWWVNGIWPSYEVRWKTPSGKSVRGVNGLHVQVVRGFTGSIDNPATFILTDSGYGYPGRAYDLGTFKAKWSWFGNTGIIVK